MSSLFWLTKPQMARVRSFFPNSHGRPWVDDLRVLSGIFFVNGTGLRWCDGEGMNATGLRKCPNREYGPAKTLYNRWKRWR